MSLTTEQPALIGQAIPRVEDERLLRGNGRYIDDLPVTGALEVAFLRSSHAHARISALNLDAARAMPGVVAIYDGASIADRLEPLLNMEELRVPPALESAVHPVVKLQPMPLLATEEVNFVGQPIAMVIAENRYLAEDALEVIEIDYESLPAVVDPEEALRPGAPKVLLDAEDNVGLSVRHGTGDVEQAFAQAAVVIEETFRSHRYVASPIETRGLVAQPDPFTDRLTVWSSTQTPHRVRNHLASALGLMPDDVRVVSVDVGGAFGQKGILYVEELLIPFVARELGRAVRWIEDRQENLTAASHAREQVHHIALAADAQGHLLAVRDRMIVNLGSRNMTGLVVPYNALCHLIGPYRVPNVDIDVVGAITNTMFTSPYRGAGRPEAAFAMDRALDRLAARLKIDPADLRARNLVPPEAMPYRTGLLDRAGKPQEYDSGDYPRMLDRARELIDLPTLRREQAQAREQGRYLGVGFSMYLEATGLGPFESATVTVQPSGKVLVATGAPSQGQGHRTSFAQIAADALGVAMGDLEVVGGDTATVPFGVGTIASRAIVTAGNAIHQASGALRTKILLAAAEMIEADPVDLELIDGQIGVRGQADQRWTLAELMRSQPFSPSGNGTQGLTETTYFQPPGFAFASGLHAVAVEVDATTGQVDIRKYVVVHDAGRIINPAIADAQIIGGLAQGLGGALYEEMIYDETGQPRTTTYMDYLLPTVEDVPEVILDEVVCPSPTNELGVKGLGEGGAVGPPGALANAVEDALRPFGVVIRSCPLTPSRIRDLLRATDNDRK